MRRWPAGRRAAFIRRRFRSVRTHLPAHEQEATHWAALAMSGPASHPIRTQTRATTSSPSGVRRKTDAQGALEMRWLCLIQSRRVSKIALFHGFPESGSINTAVPPLSALGRLTADGTERSGDYRVQVRPRPLRISVVTFWWTTLASVVIGPKVGFWRWLGRVRDCWVRPVISAS
jgi:hypothetical protein